MDEAEISRYLTETLAGVEALTMPETWFFFYNPPHLPPHHMFPFATLTASDEHDQFSDLNRPGVFRLNMGVGKQTFRDLFGTPDLPTPKESAEGKAAPGFDFTALDRLMPHPVYGKMYWVCVLNPSEATFEAQVKPLLTEAYEMAVSKRAG